MALEAHISELIEKHRVLDQELQEEMSHPLGNEIRIADLKKRKLYLKDEIARLQSRLEEVA